MIKKVIFFDFETNGVNEDNSVLSLSAMKISYNTETNEMIELGKFNRFYYRNKGEAPNLDAIKVNGLSDDVITQIRKEQNANYPITFREDIESFYEFCDGALHFVAHNIAFDRKFLPFKLEYQFDTMKENIYIVKIPSNNFSGYKWPKLMECANYYNVPLEESKLHGSMYDVEIMARVFYRMSRRRETYGIIRRFLVDNISTRI